MTDEAEAKEAFNALGRKEKKHFGTTIQYDVRVSKYVSVKAYDAESAKKEIEQEVGEGKIDLWEFDDVEDVGEFSVEVDEDEIAEE